MIDVCRVCGCTDIEACPEGCTWVEPGLCSECACGLCGHELAVDEQKTSAWEDGYAHDACIEFA